MNELILHCIIFFAGCLFVLILKETGVLSKFEKYAYRKKFDKLADEHLIKLSEAGKKGSAAGNKFREQIKKGKFDLKKAWKNQNKMKDV
jgi:hypothetical protein